MAIASLRFINFKVFRDAELPLGRTTLIIGPNGAGKTTCVQAIDLMRSSQSGNVPSAKSLRSLTAPPNDPVKIEVKWDGPNNAKTGFLFKNEHPYVQFTDELSRAKFFSNARVFAFQHDHIADVVPLAKNLEMERTGRLIPSVLTTLQDQYPERWDQLNKDLSQLLPEFDRILLDTPQLNTRAFELRTKQGKYRVPAGSLSQGTLFAVALLTLSNLPEPPPLIAIEDPDRGMHPRLLKDVLAAVHRLSHPDEFGDSRSPVQVILTTHSPYFVDLFSDHLEDVVVLEKNDLSSSFKSLSKFPNVLDIVQDASLGETWFNGLLGGVPVHT
jgi:predicted ATPase